MIFGIALKAFLKANIIPLLLGVAALVGISLLYFGVVHKGRVVQAAKDQPKVTAGAISQAVTPVRTTLTNDINKGAGKVAGEEAGRQKVLNEARAKVRTASTVPTPTARPLVDSTEGLEDRSFDNAARAFVDGLARMRDYQAIP